MIKREIYMKKIRPFFNTELVKVLTGIRRCGKSVMLELIKEELIKTGVDSSQFISINFEDLKYMHLQNATSLHNEIVNKYKEINKKLYLFFDEIQEVESWEKCINSLRVSIDCDIYITGSNAKLLSGELATYLAGRYIEFIIYPFSLKEYIELQKEKNIIKTNDEYFKDYLIYGGMPYLANLNYDSYASKQYLQDLFNSVQLKDIIKRHNVRDIDLLERIIAYVINNIGTTFSSSSLSNFFKNEQRKVAPDTILNYIKYCEDAFLCYNVKREDIKGKTILKTQEKYYIVDHGIKEAVYGNNIKDINLTLKNIVYIELLRRGYKVTVGKNNNNEIDFIAHKPNEKIYYQVCYMLYSDETREREFNAYKNINDNYPKYVLSLDSFDFSYNGIKHINIIDFLLNE